jgi:hypothetical protein
MFAKQDTANWREQTQSAIMCKAAALETGFIGNADLPNIHALPKGVTAVPLDDPAELHDAIGKAVT